VQVPLLPIYRAREVEHAVRTTGAGFLIVSTTSPEYHVGGARPIVVDRASLPRADVARLPPPPVDPRAVRWIFHTSGTTADPKGARHTDASIIAASASYAEAIGLTEDDRLPIVFPVAHIGGIIVHCCSYLAGSASIFVERFEPAAVIDVLVREKVTLPGPSQVFHLAFMDAQRRHPEGRLFPHARGYTNGGAAKNPELHFQLKELMGVGLYSNYGLTECPLALCMPLSAPEDKRAATEGRPVRGMQVRFVDADERDVGPGEVGELRLRGPLLFAGYVDASLDVDAFDTQGFFRTGDLARQDDDGYIQIVGRLKDIIIRKGENISAKELEDLLFEHPAVREVAVVGVPDPVSGERCCAVIVAADPSQPLPIDSLATYLRDAGLMIQKIPEQWVALDALPRNQVGKVLKNELRAHVIAQG
jgi:acyl-CoA synthetase (AMP-forming)/AMP-acid ligase II